MCTSIVSGFGQCTIDGIVTSTIAVSDQAQVEADASQLVYQKNNCEGLCIPFNTGNAVFTITASGDSSVEADSTQQMYLENDCQSCSISGTTIFDITASDQALVETDTVQLLRGESNQPEIARILQISQPTVNRDLQYLRQEAKENIRRYIDEKLPFEYQKCLVGLDAILRKTWDIANSMENLDRDRLQAISVGMQAYAMKIDLLTNATVVQKAIDFVERNRDYAEQYMRLRIGDTTQLRVAISNDVTESKQDTG